MTVRAPNPVYYPSCVVNLRLRFDEALVFNAKGAAAFSYTSEEVLKFALTGDEPTDIPLFLQKGREDGVSFVNGRIPTRASIELPAYREAGKFSLTFDYRDLPIDPRMVRSCGVEIYLDAVPPENFADGVVASAPPQGERVSMLTKRARASQLLQSVDNLALVGTVDSWQVEHSTDGSTITMEGRDNRSILLAQMIDPRLLPKIPLKKDIVQVVAYIVESLPFGGRINVKFPPSVLWPNGVIPSPASQGGATAFRSSQTRVRQGAQGGGATVSAGAQPDKINCWDLITRYCTLVGAVPYFKGNDLWVAPARNLYAQATAGGTDTLVGTPFKDGQRRDVGEATGLSIRRLIFGRNIESLNYERKFSGFVPRTIEVVSLDTSSTTRGPGKLLIAQWPARKGTSEGAGVPSDTAFNLGASPENAAVSQVAPSGEVGNKDKLRISVPGVADKKKLLQIAQDIYEELNRGEQGGSVKTRDLASFGAGNEDPDLLRLRPGDAMELLVDASAFTSSYPIRSPLTDDAKAAPAALEKEIAKRIGDAALARAIVATSRNLVANLQNFFRVKNVKFDWDVASGVSVAFDFENYIEARNAVTPIPRAPAGARPGLRNTGRNVPRRP